MKHGFIKVAAATPKVTVADPAANAAAVIKTFNKARNEGVKLLVFPELCLTGATCGDLFFQQTLLEGALTALRDVCAATNECDMLVFVGLPLSVDGLLYNCAAVIQNGAILGLIPKTNIEPHETRYFTSGGNDLIRSFYSAALGWLVLSADIRLMCEDMPEIVIAAEIGADLWAVQTPSERHTIEGATIIVNLSADPETVARDEYRRTTISAHSARLNCAYIYANAGWGESTTDFVYTGHNIIAENGEILTESEAPTGLLTTDIDVARLVFERRQNARISPSASFWNFRLDITETKLTRRFSPKPFVPEDTAQLAKRCEEILKLQSLGLARRLEHASVKHPVLGVSGGLDSTLAALVTVRALDFLGLPPENLIAVTMPCFGTTGRTKSNAMLLAESLGATLRVIDIGESVKRHFADIGHDYENTDVVFENAQARERTQVLMDIANGCNGLVVGTGDLSELALGWATYNGDHMSMYGVNAGVPKTLVRHLVEHCASDTNSSALAEVLRSVLETPVSPELLPADDGEISQKTEDLVGPYELHDFFLFYALRRGFAPPKILRIAYRAFENVYDEDTILKWLRVFYRRFFSQQFKRSCMPDGPKIGTLSLSPRGGLNMPSDASARLWLESLDSI